MSFTATHLLAGCWDAFAGKREKFLKLSTLPTDSIFMRGAPLANRTFFKWAEMWMAHYTDAIITINEEDYKAAQKFNLRNGGNVYCIPGVGIDTKDYRIEGIDRENFGMNLA